MDILRHAYNLIRANKGASGIDGVTFEEIEGMEGGQQKNLEGIAEELRRREYKPMPVRGGIDTEGRRQQEAVGSLFNKGRDRADGGKDSN